jgi:hypothetical protein
MYCVISTTKKSESKTIPSVHLWLSTSAPSPRTLALPPNIFFRPRRHPSTSIVPITPVDPPPPTPSICLEDAQLSVPARIGVPSRRILWCGGYQEIGGEAADRLCWRWPAAIGRRRLLTRRPAAAIVEVKPVLHLPGLLPHRRRHEAADRRRRPAAGGRRGPPTPSTHRRQRVDAGTTGFLRYRSTYPHRSC